MKKEANTPKKIPDAPPPTKPVTPTKPDVNPDPTAPKLGGNQPEKNDPTRIQEPPLPGPATIDEPPVPEVGQSDDTSQEKNRHPPL